MGTYSHHRRLCSSYFGFVFALAAVLFVSFLTLSLAGCGARGVSSAVNAGAESTAGNMGQPGGAPAKAAWVSDIPDASALPAKNAELSAMCADARMKSLSDRFYSEVARIYGAADGGNLETPAALAGILGPTDTGSANAGSAIKGGSGGISASGGASQLDSARDASKVPGAGYGDVTDLSATNERHGTIVLSWSYANAGDYNQDGEVNIADITPIAQNFGAKTTDGQGNDAAEAVVDGSGNGEVGVEDVTLIALNFYGNVSSYVVEMTPPGGADWIELPKMYALDLINATTPDSGGKKRFSVMIGAGYGGVAAPVLLYTRFRIAPLDALGVKGAFSPEYLFSNAANIAPIAHGVATPYEGLAPLNVNFSAGASVDTDGTIVKYEWDIDRDGIFSDFTSTGGNASHTFTSVGRYDPILRVTDDEGATGVNIASVFVPVPGNVAPQVYAEAHPGIGVAPITITFSAYATDGDGEVVRYEWDFGDGYYIDFTSQKGDGVHTFDESAVGTRVCTLRVMDDGYRTAMTTVNVEVLPPWYGSQGQPPVAQAAAWPVAGQSPLSVTLISNLCYDPDGRIAYYEWDFDSDGKYDWASTQQDPVTHVYSEGTWGATLRVTDNNGNSATATVGIIAYPLTSHWQAAIVDQFTGNDKIDYGAVGAAISPTTGELCIAYPADIAGQSFLRTAWLKTAGGWRYEDYSGDYSGIDSITRPVFMSDGTLVVGAVTDQSVELLIRDPQGDWTTHQIRSGGDYPIAVKDGLDVSPSGKVGITFVEGRSAPCTYYFSEYSGGVDSSTIITPSNVYTSFKDIEYFQEVAHIFVQKPLINDTVFLSELVWDGSQTVENPIGLLPNQDSTACTRLFDVNGEPAASVLTKQNQLWTFYWSDGIWGASVGDLTGKLSQPRAPYDFCQAGLRQYYLIGWNSAGVPMLMYKQGPYIWTEPIDKSPSVSYNFIALAASADKVYAVGYDGTAKTVYLFTRNAPQ